MLRRTTPMKFFWAREYSDYHPEAPGGSAAGRTCECRPLNTSMLGEYLPRLRPGVLEVKVPMPTTGADYRWMNLMARVPRKGLPTIAKRLAQGVGGLAIGRRYAAGGQALAAGLFSGVLSAGIPIWTHTSLVALTEADGRVTGAIVDHGGRRITVTARRGVVLAAGGFDHDMEMRRKFQSEALGDGFSLGADTNTGDAIRIAQELGAGLGLMDQAWWFPAVAPLPGKPPAVMLAERSLPGSLIVNQNGDRFVNESTDYMSFGQRMLHLERQGRPVESMWIVFDQQYRNGYVFAAELFPRMAIPQSWYDSGIACRADTLADLARRSHCPRRASRETMRRFNEAARAGIDGEFHRGESAYDRYYGDPTITPNPNLRPLDKGPVLRGQDGAERSRHLRRLARRRAGAGSPRGRDRDRRSLRDRQHRGQRVRRDLSRCGRDDCAGTGVRVHRRHEMRPGADGSRQLGSSASAFFSISYQYSVAGQGILVRPPCPICGKVASASSSSLIILSASSRSFA